MTEATTHVRTEPSPGTPAVTTPDYLRIEGVTRLYPTGGGVREVDLTLPRGEMLVLLGPSGCGKTTLLRVLAGLLEPDAGQVVLDGRDLTRVPTHRRNVGMVFQTWALFPTMSVWDNVAFGLRMRRLPRARRDERVGEVLDLVGLREYAGRKPRELSGGQQQRVALARAIVTEPAIMLLDEPLSSLDHRIRVQLRGQLKRLQRSLGLTGVYVTHDHTEALALGDRIAVMDGGRVIETGAPIEVFSRPRHRYTAEFLGLANVIPVTPLDGSRALRTAFGDVVEPSVPVTGDAPVVAVALRPDRIRLTEAGGSGGAHRGSVTAVEYQPGGVLHEVALPDGTTVQVVVGDGPGLPVGTPVDVAFDWSQAVPLID
ncbi:MAG TPA: ABC transporter ATP-binding protein [Pseudonocardiaceae bacterium]